MIKIGKTLISDDLRDAHFVCHLPECNGDCCVEGDAGAPLEEEEISILEDYLDEIKPFMTKAGKAVVEKMGVFDYDADGSYVTPLIQGLDCAFVYKENGINFCAIEKAFLENKIKFQKPISCHLYPIRLKQVDEFVAVNYEKWSICRPAVIMGREKSIPLYRFLKQPLVRRFGEEWFEQLDKEINKIIPNQY